MSRMSSGAMGYTFWRGPTGPTSGDYESEEESEGPEMTDTQILTLAIAVVVPLALLMLFPRFSASKPNGRDRGGRAARLIDAEQQPVYRHSGQHRREQGNSAGRDADLPDRDAGRIPLSAPATRRDYGHTRRHRQAGNG